MPNLLTDGLFVIARSPYHGAVEEDVPREGEVIDNSINRRLTLPCTNTHADCGPALLSETTEGHVHVATRI